MRIAVLLGIVLGGLLAAGPANAQAQAPTQDQPSASASAAETKELLEAARATAKAARENVDYARVVPDILTQILALLDKIVVKLVKVVNAVNAGAPPL